MSAPLSDSQIDPHTFKIGGTWGHHVSFSGYKSGSDTQSVYGHLPLFTTFPKVGDLLEVDMQSGKVAVFRFIEVKRQLDPDDMFMGRVKFAHYKGET